MSSASNDHPAAERNSSAPVTVTWPSQTSPIVTQPIVSWVTRVIRQESTNRAAERRIARRAVELSRTPRAAAIGSRMHITVLVPKRKASSTRGASVRSTSHSGMTTLSSTWLVHSTPMKKVALSHPTLRSGPGPGSCTRRCSGLRSSWGALGRRMIEIALTTKITPVHQGSARITVLDSKASATPPTSEPRVKPRLSAE